MLERIRNAFKGDPARRAVRTFLQVFIPMFLASLVGWLGSVQEWTECLVRTGGGCPDFPSPSVLAGALASAVVAGVISVVTWVQNALEDRGSIRSLLKHERGATGPRA